MMPSSFLVTFYCFHPPFTLLFCPPSHNQRRKKKKQTASEVANVRGSWVVGFRTRPFLLDSFFLLSQKGQQDTIPGLLWLRRAISKGHSCNTRQRKTYMRILFIHIDYHAHTHKTHRASPSSSITAAASLLLLHLSHLIGSSSPAIDYSVYE